MDPLDRPREIRSTRADNSDGDDDDDAAIDTALGGTIEKMQRWWATTGKAGPPSHEMNSRNAKSVPSQRCASQWAVAQKTIKPAPAKLLSDGCLTLGRLPLLARVKTKT